MNEQQLARGLGWFSIGLGLAEIFAPRKLAEGMGVRRKDQLLPWLGVREIASGISILSQDHPAIGVWSRVGGDVMNLSLLASALQSRRSDRRRVGVALTAALGITALDVYCGMKLNARRRADTAEYDVGVEKTKTHRSRLVHTVTINCPVDEVYRFWRNFQNLPQFMNHLESVSVIDPQRSHWVAKGPAGSKVDWDAEIFEERPNELIAWRSQPGSTVKNAGSVRFESVAGGRATVVRVKLQYDPPGGIFGVTVANLLGEAPEKQIPADLRRIKQLLETGEFAAT